jgi:transposase-like protein
MANENPREIRGLAIAETQGHVARLGSAEYEVKSQSGKGFYHVRFDGVWKCSCPDHIYREIKCKHIWACELSSAIRERVQAQAVTIQAIGTLACVVCGSDAIVKDSLRHNKYGDIQRYLCKSCGKRFSFNLGFERMKARPEVITSAMQLYFTGESLRNVQKFLRLQGVNVSHVAVYKWIAKYVRLMEKYLDQIKPQVGDTWRADEMYLKVKGNPKYLYALLDDQTRFWIAKEVAGDKMSREAVDYASQLFQQGKEVTGKKPLTLITDGLKAYHLAYKREFFSLKAPRTEHLTWQDNGVDNRKMESFNGNTVRSREKTMRSLKKSDTPIIAGMQIFHNYLRPNQGIGNRTPSELAGIEVQGENKWVTLIQNASRHPTVNRKMNHPRT